MDYWVWLANIEGLGAVRKIRALQKFRSVERFFYASREEILSLEGFGESTYQKILKSKDCNKINIQVSFMNKLGIKYINFFDENYPKNLKNIYDMPITLFYKGDLNVFNESSVAIIGSRNASIYGKKCAYNIAKEVAQRFVVVSGVARGIDSFSHYGCVDARGKTIGVLGCGLDIIYPSENVELYKKIVNNGILISEYPLGTRPFAENFPIRNRIISGLADKIVVVEAAVNSGTMITVGCALEQGKDVYAVPGNVDSELSEGTNILIKEGAGIYTCLEDLG